jgi:hemerythrin-like domain-containing protein
VIQPADLCAPRASSEKQTLDRPLDHLVACHRRIEERLATLERVTPHWQSRKAEVLDAVRNCLRFFDTNGAWHTEDEEQSIFPRFAGQLNEDEQEYLAELARQHDVAEGAYEDVKRVIASLESQAEISDEAIGTYNAAVTRLAALYRAHIASEDSRLVAIGTRVLGEDSLRQISREMKRRRGLAE